MEDDAQVYTFKMQLGTKGVAAVDTDLMSSLEACLNEREDADDDFDLPPSEALEAV